MKDKKFKRLVEKSPEKPPFNELAKPNMSDEAKAVMEEAMQKSCDEQDKLAGIWELHCETCRHINNYHGAI